MATAPAAQKQDVPSDKIRLEIVTPNGRALEANVDEVTAPSVDGEFGVMPGHLPLLATLRTGLMSYRIGNETKQLAIGTGFAEVGPNKVDVLTNEYATRDQIDPVVAQKELEDVQAALAKLEQENPNAEADPARTGLLHREHWAATRLELYGYPPPATMRPHETWGPPGPTDDDDVPSEEGSEKL